MRGSIKVPRLQACEVSLTLPFPSQPRQPQPSPALPSASAAPKYLHLSSRISDRFLTQATYFARGNFAPGGCSKEEIFPIRQSPTSCAWRDATPRVPHTLRQQRYAFLHRFSAFRLLSSPYSCRGSDPNIAMHCSA